MNLLYRAPASAEGTVSKLLNIMHSKGLFEKCTVITQTVDNNDYYDDSIFHEIKASYGYQCSYGELVDSKFWPEIDGSIWEKLNKYKSTVFNMMCRKSHIHIMNYEEMEQEYIQHVRFWKYVLDSDSINCVFFVTMPHWPWEYVLYALAKVMRIPVLIETISNVFPLFEVGTDIDNIGQNTHIVYNREKKKHNDLEGYSKEFYDRVKNMTTYTAPTNLNGRKEQREWVYNSFYKPYKLNFDDFLAICSGIIKGNLGERLNGIVKKITVKKKIDREKRKYVTIEYLNDFEKDGIDNKEKYVFFAMQYFPESSVLPRGGVFQNQLLAIRLLARALESRSVKLYVKEHWISDFRYKMFYDELLGLPNVVCLPTTTDTYSIIDSSMAVASMTGTCMMEAIIRGIPVLNFAQNDLVNAPGVFRVKDYEDIISAVDTISKDDFSISVEEVKQYFAIIERTHPVGYLDIDDIKDDNMIGKFIDDSCDLLCKFIESGMDEGFVFAK